MKKENRRSVAVVGLGYVGLPIAIAFGKQSFVIGFDVNKGKIEELRKGIDRTGEVSKEDFAVTKINFTWEPTDLKVADFIIVAVPTPITEALQPGRYVLLCYPLGPEDDEAVQLLAEGIVAAFTVR